MPLGERLSVAIMMWSDSIVEIFVRVVKIFVFVVLELEVLISTTRRTIRIFIRVVIIEWIQRSVVKCSNRREKNEGFHLAE